MPIDSDTLQLNVEIVHNKSSSVMSSEKQTGAGIKRTQTHQTYQIFLIIFFVDRGGVVSSPPSLILYSFLLEEMKNSY